MKTSEQLLGNIFEFGYSESDIIMYASLKSLEDRIELLKELASVLPWFKYRHTLQKLESEYDQRKKELNL